MSKIDEKWAELRPIFDLLLRGRSGFLGGVLFGQVGIDGIRLVVHLELSAVAE